MKVAHGTTSSTDAPRVHIGPRPALPAQRLFARPLSRDLAGQGWEPIPTAPYRPAPMNRQQLAAAIAADASENDRVIPKFPGQRRSPEQKPAPVPGQRTAVYDDIVLRYGEHAAHGCF
jgi:hypothetical protein